MVAAAMIGAAVVGAGASAASASSQSRAANSAAATQANSNNQAIALQREVRDEARQTFAKYQPAGDAARNKMASFAGVYSTPDQTAEQAQEAAWKDYQSTPWAQIGRTSARNAQDKFLSLAGSQGSSLSGRTARGMADVANEAEQGAFGGYYSALGGFADQGFAADTATINAGQGFADAATGLMTNSARAAGDATMTGAKAWGTAMEDAAGWAGWAAGNIGQINSNKPAKTGG